MNACVLTINAGSSSLRFALFLAAASPERLVSGRIERIGSRGAALAVTDASTGATERREVEAPDHAACVSLVSELVEAREHTGAIGAIGHRVVHGGPRYSAPQRITPEVLDELRRLSPYDPEHMPAELSLIDAFAARYPDVPQVACFDTAFHHELPRVAQLLPLPRRYEAHGVRRYGFHGLSRFQSFKSMAASFYQTDLFIRDVTDSGTTATGGISGPKVREALRQIQQRHQRVKIPVWMQTYFGWNLLENVEKQCAPLTADEQRLHLAYMAKTYRIMGIPFSEDREGMDRFARLVEDEQAAITASVPRHSRHILRLGEMIGVASSRASILPMLAPRTRSVFKPLYPEVRRSLPGRLWARLLGKLFIPKAVGEPRKAVPLPD